MRIRILMPLFWLAGAACGGAALNDLVIRTVDPGYQQIAAIRLAVPGPGGEALPLTNGSRLTIEPSGMLHLAIDLRATAAPGQIRLFDEMARGLAATLRLVDAGTGRDLVAAPVPDSWHSGVSQVSPVTTHYDRFGQVVLTNRITEGVKVPTGLVSYANDSLVRIDLRPPVASLTDGQAAVLLLELDYAAYRDPESVPDGNRIPGKKLSETLSGGSKREVTVTAIHVPRLRGEKRRTVPLFVRLARPAGWYLPTRTP